MYGDQPVDLGVPRLFASDYTRREKMDNEKRLTEGSPRAEAVRALRFIFGWFVAELIMLIMVAKAIQAERVQC